MEVFTLLFKILLGVMDLNISDKTYKAFKTRNRYFQYPRCGTLSKRFLQRFLPLFEHPPRSKRCRLTTLLPSDYSQTRAAINTTLQTKFNAHLLQTSPQTHEKLLVSRQTPLYIYLLPKHPF